MLHKAIRVISIYRAIWIFFSEPFCSWPIRIGVANDYTIFFVSRLRLAAKPKILKKPLARKEFLHKTTPQMDLFFLRNQIILDSNLDKL